MATVGPQLLFKPDAHLSQSVPVWVRFERHSATGVFGDVPPDLAHLPDYDSASGHIPFHGHDFCEIAVFLDGEATHLTEQGTQTLRRGSVVVVPCGGVHGYDTDREITLINVFYIGEWLATDLPELWRDPVMMHLFLAGALFNAPQHLQASLVALEERAVQRAVSEIADLGERLQSGPHNVAYMRACLMKLLSLIAEAYGQQWSDTPTAAFRREVWVVLEAVEECLGTGDGLDVREVAGVCKLSPEHLSRLFRDAVGLTVMQYFQKRRAQRACRLLARRDSTLTEVAHVLGFADYGHFRRQFVRYMNMTPRAFMDRGETLPGRD